jgi:hypothetical protein
MNRLLPAALLSCAAAAFSSPSWSFLGFDFFEQLQHSIECARKPGADYLTCSNKVVSQDDDDGDDATPVAEPVVVVKPKTYFVKVEDAFPDPVDAYWFHLDEGEELGDDEWRMGAGAAVKLADIDNDGLPEIIMYTAHGPGRWEYRQKFLPYLDPPRTKFVIYDYQDSKFHDVTDLYFNSEPIIDSATGIYESRRAEIDINQDGQIDIFYTGHQEDGARRPAEYGSSGAYLFGLISQWDGTYEIQQFGERKWWHNVKVGRDEQGIPYVVGAGFVENGIDDEGVFRYTDNDVVQNERYYWDHNTDKMITQLNDNFPDIFPGGMTIMTSRYGDFTDQVVQIPTKVESADFQQRTGAWPMLALQGYYLDEPYGEWQKTPILELQAEKVGEFTWKNWLGYEHTETALEINGYVGMVDFASTNPLCNFTLYKNQPTVILTSNGIKLIPDFEEGMYIEEGQLNNSANLLHFVELQNGELSRVPVEIDNYDPVAPLPLCVDVNSDGYDDIVSPYHYGGQFGREISNHVFYINQQDGTFKKLEIPVSERPQLPEKHTLEIAKSVIADFDGDGIVDTVFYPFNLLNYNGYHIDATYTGMEDHLQFYKGTGKILEDQ